MNTIAQKIIGWYKKNTRDLPWRNTADPYHIWISEVILQQTRIEQGTAYYLRFLEAFPTVHHLANASEEEVLKQWQGLGYYSRARNLHKAAKQVASDFNGKIPNTYKELIKLRGVGPYTAGAVLSIAFNKPAVAIDGNVYRVLARLFEEPTPINTPAAYKLFGKIVESFMPSDEASAFNQGLIELGALICKPKPNCQSCPLQANCSAFTNHSQLDFPVKQKKRPIKHRYFHFLDVRFGESTFIERRKGGDIWQGLYQFPLIETTHKTETDTLMQMDEWQQLLPVHSVNAVSVSKEFVHQLTHQQLHARFYQIELNKLPGKLATGYERISRSQLCDIAIPRLVEKYLLS
jgi:A/G-specific adenine glycosylase